MPIARPVAARPASARPLPARGLAALVLLSVLLPACGTSDPTPTPASSGSPAGSGSAAATGTPAPTATPVPTPEPTPRFTNPPDPELAALIPGRVAGVPVVVPPVDQFPYTPGDFGEAAYGELGLRFSSLQVAYIEEPRLSLFVARVDGPPVTTQELEPHLETAGRAVGIAGLVREPWELVTIRRRVAWVRPEDNATAAGTMIYTWAADGFVFLMIGVDDRVNRALFAALPGERAPRSSGPSASPSGSGEPSASASP